MVELFFNRIILQIQHMTPDCTRQRAPMFFFQRRVTRKTISLRATEICAFIAKKTKTNPRVKASKSELYWRGPLFDCVKFRALLGDKETELSFSCYSMSKNTWDYCQRVMCVCACALQWNLCPAMCGLLFYRLWTFIREFNLHVVYPIGIFIIFFCYFIIIMCIILVYSLCTWILNCDYFTLCYSSQLQGIVRELRYRHDYF